MAEGGGNQKLKHRKALENKGEGSGRAHNGPEGTEDGKTVL